MQNYLTMEIEIRPEANNLKSKIKATAQTLREIADALIELDADSLDDADNRLCMVWNSAPNSLLKFKRENIAKEKMLREMFEQYHKEDKKIIGVY